ncbi:hypothetical protein DSO57_1014938 [Entomophthora muscae]|uniref:Uncharacterized protein n=2 Tax=Entomophthora muscae TaxID=34485 RepID=A0ACC2RFL7_9FUNG|nr:hypothetical protein DSO57_1030624 [Entomophthora muscae]KAJ9065896.1 hypothetical protein DSO57_1014938 [Entomophthora muscae]
MDFINDSFMFNMPVQQVWSPESDWSCLVDSQAVDMFLLEQMFSWNPMDIQNYWLPPQETPQPPQPEVLQGLPIDMDLGPGINIPRRKPTILSMDPDQPILYCKFCRQPFSRRNSLRRHEQLHSGHKPYKCSPCGRSFSRQDIFKRHCASKRCKRLSSSAKAMYS